MVTPRFRYGLDGPFYVVWNPRKLLRRGLVQNIVALYGVQICTYALPLMTFPYLARVLGPSGWGSVVFAQAIGVRNRYLCGVRL